MSVHQHLSSLFRSNVSPLINRFLFLCVELAEWILYIQLSYIQRQLLSPKCKILHCWVKYLSNTCLLTISCHFLTFKKILCQRQYMLLFSPFFPFLPLEKVLYVNCVQLIYHFFYNYMYIHRWISLSEFQQGRMVPVWLIFKNETRR